MRTLNIFSAGVAAKLAKETSERFQRLHPDVDCQVETGGSTGGIQKLLHGTHYDVMILADCSNIDQMMMPDYADGYFVWAGNSIAAIGEGIDGENWREKLTDPACRILHVNPYNDPGGYRAVMAMELADHMEPGLGERMLHDPNYKGLDRSQYTGRPDLDHLTDGTYFLGYKSIAVARGLPFADLPGEMNLGDPRFEELYQTVHFTVDGGAEISGTTILHGIVIPKNTENRALAEDFAGEFLSIRFTDHGFTPVQRKVGVWTVKQPNMWDAESRSYSLMTLMEVNGTNRQLDAMPLEPDMVVLDCGCGPGRVAIQAAKRVKKVICLDNSQGMMEECRKNCAAAGVTNVEFILADWQEAEIGVTIPEVDVVIQSRGGGGPSTLSMLRKAARRYAVNVIWSQGAPNLPMSREKLFTGCYSEEDMLRYPELRPFAQRSRKPGDKRLFGRETAQKPGLLPMNGPAAREMLAAEGIELHVTTVPEGWDRQFATRQEAYDLLIALSRHPELVDQAQFRRNVDRFLTERDGGFYFFLPTSSDVSWFQTRP